MDPVLDDIGNFATGLAYVDLPPSVVSAAKDRLLDALGCAVAAYDGQSARIAHQLAGAPAKDTFAGRILGGKASVAADTAAYANTCMIRDLDLNDDYPGGHPSDGLGSLFAISPTIGASGERLIAAVVVTYETTISLLRAVPLRDLGWDQSIAIGIGSAAGLANLLQLDAAAVRHAISITTVANAALRATRAGQLSMWKGAATAYAVRNAVFAVQLAQAGMTGPESPFVGRHGFAEMVSGRPLERPHLGGREENFHIQDVYTKCWPVAYSLQALVWAGIELRKQVEPSAVSAIEVYTYAFSMRESGSEPAKWDPRTRETADHSIPYVLVRAILDGTIDHDAFEPEAYLDPSIRPLMSKVTVHVADDIEEKIRRDIVEMRVVAKDHSGRTFSVTILNPLGHKENPLPQSEMAERFVRLCSPVLGPSSAETALQQWLNIEAADNVIAAFDSLEAKPHAGTNLRSA